MARNLLLGSYSCNNVEHSHSTQDEVTACNNIEKARMDKEHEMGQKRVQLEQTKADIDKLAKEQDIRREKMKHEEKMAKLELERMQLENKTNEQKKKKSKLCAII